MVESKLISVRDAALQLGTSLKQIYRWIEAGKVGPVVIEHRPHTRGQPRMMMRRRVVGKLTGRVLS